MSDYTYIFYGLINFGSGSGAWGDIYAQLYTLGNVASGSPIHVTDLVDFGSNWYLWTTTFQRGTKGVLKFYRSGSPSVILSESLVNDETYQAASRLAPD